MKLFLRNGYLAVALYNGKKSIQRFVHRLVANAFIKKKYKWLDCVHHKDEDKANANVNNLEWSIQAYNVAMYQAKHKGDTNIDRAKKTLSSAVVEFDLNGNKISEYNTPQATGYHCKELYACLRNQIPFRGSLFIYKHELAC